jgi:hypothetical protein
MASQRAWLTPAGEGAEVGAEMGDRRQRGRSGIVAPRGVALVTACLAVVTAVVASTSSAGLESRHWWALRYATCQARYVVPSMITVDPPRMWADYDTTGRLGQRVAWRAAFWRWDGSRWAQVDVSAWESSFARNQLPRSFDPGNLVTYTNGTWIFTGAEQGNAATQFDHQPGYLPDYTGTYRVTIEMRWFRNRWGAALFVRRFVPFTFDLGSDHSLDCVVTQ